LLINQVKPILEGIQVSDKQEKDNKDYIDETKDVKSFKELEDYSSEVKSSEIAKSSPKEEKDDPEEGKNFYKVRLINEELEASAASDE